MFIPLAFAMGVFGLIYSKQQEIQNKIQELNVSSMFTGPHDFYPTGYQEAFEIDGGVTANLPARGNPEPRNPMREVFTYPNSKDSYIINKNNSNWKDTELFSKEKQKNLLELHYNLESPHYFLDPCNRINRFQSPPPKINLKNIS